MDVERWVEGVKEVATVRRVYGEAYEKDGVSVIPVASVRGGGGGGGGRMGRDEQGQQGGGSGLGFTARPAGVYVIKSGNVSWQPALNVNRIVAGAQFVALTAFVTLVKARRRKLRT